MSGELGYDRLFDDEPAPLRMPMDQVRRSQIEELITSGYNVDELTYARLVTPEEMNAYLSDASSVFPGDNEVKAPGDFYDDAA